jgi:chorismate-pyruvate lyase
MSDPARTQRLKRGGMALLVTTSLWFEAALNLHAASPVPPWPDTYLARVEALALLQSLNADLLSHDSATLTLERWCAEHHLASPAQVSAQRVHDTDKPADSEQRQLLRVDANEPVRYRHVKLVCGAVTLSEADNWYVPSRLTADMAAQLDQTDVPFGKVVQALHFARHTLTAQLLWAPLPAGWEGLAVQPPATGRILAIPDAVLQHKALLSLPDGTPFSEVVETYTAEILAFPPPPGVPSSQKR